MSEAVGTKRLSLRGNQQFKRIVSAKSVERGIFKAPHKFKNERNKWKIDENMVFGSAGNGSIHTFCSAGDRTAKGSPYSFKYR